MNKNRCKAPYTSLNLMDDGTLTVCPTRFFPERNIDCKYDSICSNKQTYNDFNVDEGIQELHLSIGNACNAECKICVIGIDKKNNITNNFDNIIQLLKTYLPTNKIKTIYLLGGETFTYKKELIEIIKYINLFDENIILKIHTNGTICDIEILKELAKHKNHILFFSIDGDDKTNHLTRHNCEMSKIEKTIKLCRNLNMNIGIVHVISLLNIFNFYKNMDYYVKILEIPYEYIHISVLVSPNNLSILSADTKLKSLIINYMNKNKEKYKIQYISIIKNIINKINVDEINVFNEISNIDYFYGINTFEYLDKNVYDFLKKKEIILC